jgi:hypothetical protein
MIICIPFFKSDISWFEILSSTIIPIILFFSGLWFGKLLEKQKEKIRQKRLIKYFFELIVLLIKKIDAQIELLKEAAFRQDDFESKDLMTIIASGESHLLLKDIDRSAIYEALVSTKRKNIAQITDAFEKIVSHIDYVYKLFTAIETNNKTLILNSIDYSNKCNDSLMKLQNTINEFKQKTNEQKKQDDFLDSVDSIIKDVEKVKKGKNYVELNENLFHIFIEPLIQLSIKHSSDQRSPIIMDLAQKIKFNYNVIKEERKKNKEYFIETAKDLKDAKTSFLEHVDNLKK